MDWGASALWPPDERLLAFLDVYSRVAACNGGNAARVGNLKNGLCRPSFRIWRSQLQNLGVFRPKWVEMVGEQWSERILHSELGKRAIDYGIPQIMTLRKFHKVGLIGLILRARSLRLFK
ncbi:MAG: hypothetical protein Ct9H300mP19_16730 [Dehalococcoidia bacterium]|nr:MAG: hypothetical protein Ct9H300mP19_16730 [Dehalococcoidia bacterium]